MDIEAGIRPLCDALNTAPGVKTLYSCEGHWWKNTDPYVIFLSSIEFAAELNCRLALCRQLAFYWRIHGVFVSASNQPAALRWLQFRLVVNSHQLDDRAFQGMAFRWVHRRTFVRDLSLIEELVQGLSGGCELTRVQTDPVEISRHLQQACHE